MNERPEETNPESNDSTPHNTARTQMDVIEIKPGQQFIGSDGSTMFDDGTIVYPNGVKIVVNEQGGGQVVLPDGRKLAPGESVTMPDGTHAKQCE